MSLPKCDMCQVHRASHICLNEWTSYPLRCDACVPNAPHWLTGQFVRIDSDEGKKQLAKYVERTLEGGILYDDIPF